MNEQYINTDVNPSFNTFNATDVNSDGVTSPLDALLVINRLNARISGQQATSEAWIYDDVSNDRSLSPIDALLVINQLNAASRSASGTPVTPVPETEPNVGSNLPDAPGLGSGEGESVAARDAYFAAYTPAYVIEAESENGSFRTGDRNVRNLRRGSR